MIWAIENNGWVAHKTYVKSKALGSKSSPYPSP
jgi:hypothetical protein